MKSNKTRFGVYNYHPVENPLPRVYTHYSLVCKIFSMYYNTASHHHFFGVFIWCAMGRNRTILDPSYWILPAEEIPKFDAVSGRPSAWAQILKARLGEIQLLSELETRLSPYPSSIHRCAEWPTCYHVHWISIGLREVWPEKNAE